MAEPGDSDSGSARRWRIQATENDWPFMAGTPSFLRSMNERRLLELLRRQGSMSRAQAARESGLSKPTVSLALGALLDAGLVQQVGRSTGGKGPSAVLYELNPTAGWVVGIDVGRRWLRAAIADIAGSMLARRDERANIRSANSLIRQIGQAAHDLAAGAGLRWEQITHATIGSPGVFDSARGLVEMAPNLPGWGRHGIVEALQDALGTKLSFENDVNLAAQGELARGQGRGIQNFVYLWVGTGTGLGIVANGSLYRGSRGAAGEIGYLPVGADPHEPSTRRRGAFEQAASGPGVVRLAQELGMRSARTAEGVFAAARRGEPVALRVVEEEGRRLALGIGAIAPVLDPELVILGGGVGRSGDLLLEPIERELQALTPFRPRIVVSALGEDAVLHGAIATALEAGRREVFHRSPRPARASVVDGERVDASPMEGRTGRSPSLVAGDRT